ncbi:MAG: class I SAM-dependent methyltransferase [bacterium]|nr:class I SAM-dependent methyltransferase [bacterium]
MKRTGQQHFKWVMIGVCVLVLLASVPGILFSSSSRAKRLQLPKLFKVIGIKPGMVIGEPGAGEGYFTFKLAREVGPAGKIYANDIDDSKLDTIKEKVRKKGFKNVVTIKGEEEDPLFPEAQLDMVFMSYMLHHIDDPVTFLKNLKASFKPNAPLVILASDPGKNSDTSGHFLGKEELMKTVQAAGYTLVRLETFLPKDNIYIYRAE